MVIARRRFLKSSLLFGASAVLFSQTARPGFARTFGLDGTLPDEILDDPLYGFTRETFEPYVGGYFEAAVGRRRTVALKLLKVEAYTPKPGTRSTDAFSLFFSAEDPLPLSGNLYQIKHGALGEFHLFLSGRNGPRGQIFYEAAFNRLR